MHAAAALKNYNKTSHAMLQFSGVLSQNRGAIVQRTSLVANNRFFVIALRVAALSRFAIIKIRVGFRLYALRPNFA